MLLPSHEKVLYSEFQVSISKTMTCRSWTHDKQTTDKLNDMPQVADYERTMKVVVGVKFATKIASRFGKKINMVKYKIGMNNFEIVIK